MKIFPAIDLLNRKCVQLVGGDPNQIKISENAVEKVKFWIGQGAEQLWIIDLNAALGKGNNLSLIKEILNVSTVPLYVGGGIRTTETANELINVGADKIIIGTKAIPDPTFLKNFDPEKIIVALDCKNEKIMIKGWQESTSLSLKELSKRINANYYLVTNIDVEGKQLGPDLKFIENAIQIIGKPVIISGGISSIEDIKEIAEFNPYAIVVGTALYTGKIRLPEALRYCKSFVGVNSTLAHFSVRDGSEAEK